MKKLLVITYYWPPSGGPGVQRWLKFVKHLSACGYQPIVVTVDADRATYPIQDPSLLEEVPADTRVYRTSTIEPFGWYRLLSRKKEVPYSGFANEGKPGWKERIARCIRGNLFIPDPRKGWNKFAVAKCLEIIEKEDICCIVTTSPPHSTQLIGLTLKEQTSLHWIADLRDPWTDLYYNKEFLRTPIAVKKDAFYERAVLENADSIIVVSDQIKRDFLRKTNNIREGKITVIPNGYDSEDFEQPSPAAAERFLITYTGTLSGEYTLDGFLRAIDEVMQRRRVPFLLRFVGSMPEDVQNKIRRYTGGKNTEFIPHVSHAEAIEYMLKSTVLLLIIPEVKHNKGILTGKLFEYIAARKPIIGLGPDDGDAASILSSTDSGRMIPYHRAQEIADYIAHLILKWEKNKNLDLERKKSLMYSRKALTKQLADIINQFGMHGS